MEVGDAQLGHLVRLAREGDVDALRALWESNRRWVAAVVLTHKPAEADADDILQDVAASLCAKISNVQDAAAFRGWLRTVAVNAARLAGRKQDLRERHEYTQPAADGAHSPRLPRTGHEQYAEREDARRVLDAAQQLPPEYREALLLRAVQGLSYRNIGEILGLPETTIETRIARGRRMLRESLTGVAGKIG